jgi:hypothetical protein
LALASAVPAIAEPPLAAPGKPAAAAKPPPPPPSPPPPAPRSNVPAYVLLGLAGAGVVAGTTFGVIALQDKSAFDSHNTADNALKTDRDALVSDVSFAAALAFGIMGTVLLLTNGSAEPPQGGATAAALAKKKSSFYGFVTPWVGPSGGGAVGVLKF